MEAILYLTKVEGHGNVPVVRRSGVYFPYWPLFLLLFDSVVEQTSELEDAIDVDEQLLAISLPLEVPK